MFWMKEVYSLLLQWKSAGKYVHWSRSPTVTFPFEFVKIIHKNYKWVGCFCSLQIALISKHDCTFKHILDSTPLSDDLCVDVKWYIKPILTRNKSTTEIRCFSSYRKYFNNWKIHWICFKNLALLCKIKVFIDCSSYVFISGKETRFLPS